MFRSFVTDKKPLIAILDKQTNLPNGWDSYGASKPSNDAIKGSLTLIELCEKNEWLTPDIFPEASGAIQFEWDAKGCSLEIIVKSENNYVLSFEGKYFDELSYREKTITFSDLIETITKIAKRAV